MYKALSELFLNSLMVANTDRMRQEKTNRKLQERKAGISVFSLKIAVNRGQKKDVKDM